MPAPRDRINPDILEQQYPAVPLPPLNVSAYSLEKNVVNIRWTSPAELNANTCFSILGVNVYRSFDSEFGPYFRLNAVPLGAGFWQDRTRVVLSLLEDVSNNFTARGVASDPVGKYVFRTRYKPIVIVPAVGAPNCTELNVQVTVNGQAAFVDQIRADTGEVSLGILPTFDVVTQEQFPPVLPTSDSDIVLATYRYIADEVVTDLNQRIFYRLTTVAYNADTGQLIETPLNRATQTNNFEVEKLDWIWREAVRRNKWILYQGGERVKVFIRRKVGAACGCNSSTHKQPRSDCLVCYGTGILGGYDGPYDAIIAPDDSAKSIIQSNRGRTQEHSYDTWTGPSPLLSQRDFIVKFNGDRYGIGPVRMPTNRGNQLQQFFPISSFDESDIRFQVPIPDPFFLKAPQTRYIIPDQGDRMPVLTEKENIRDERELRGNTVTWENIDY
jgi:hypothetical protein